MIVRLEDAKYNLQQLKTKIEELGDSMSVATVVDVEELERAYVTAISSTVV